MTEKIDRYEVKIYLLLLVIFLIFAIGFTYVLIQQKQLIDKYASEKNRVTQQVAPSDPSTIFITAKIAEGCTGKTFALEYRQANSRDIRSLEASLRSENGEIKMSLPKERGNFNSDTEFIIRGEGYLAKRKSIDNTGLLSFGTLYDGDVNSDDQVNQKDVDRIKQAAKSNKTDDTVDLNCDGSVDQADVERVNAVVGKVSDL